VATQALTWLTVFDSKGVVGGGIAIIPLDLPGVTRGKPTELIGMQDFPQCEIFFNDVRIPKDYMLIGPELYENAFSQFLNMTGLAVWTVFTGLARAAFEEALAYSKRRVQGGKPIAEHQIIKLKLFDMFTKVEASRALSRAVAKYCLTATDTIPVEYSTVAKVYCSQVAFEVANEAVQIHGAYGYTKDALVGKLLRDARVASIMDGCNEVISLKDSYRLIERYNPLE
jgi:alkylation response protein AidB-like acyl-CoA dehydrogenase